MNRNDSKRYSFRISDDLQKLEKKSLDAAKAIYGDPLPDVVKERLEVEFKAIENVGCASDYLIAASLTKRSEDLGYPASTRGSLGSSLAAFLCRISAVNPLPAHYYCPSCHRFELYRDDGDFQIMGQDLPDKECPSCGKLMKSDGVDIPPETLFGMQMDREPAIALNFAPEIRSAIIAYLKESYEAQFFRAGVSRINEQGELFLSKHPGGIYILPHSVDIRELTAVRDPEEDDEFQMPVTMRDYGDLSNRLKKYDLLTHDALSMLHELEVRTGLRHKDIALNDSEVTDACLTEESAPLASRLMRRAKPDRFSDVVRVDAMMHGVGTCTYGEEMLEKGHHLRDLIAFREDVMQQLMRRHISKENAYKIMRCIHQGKRLTEDQEFLLEMAGFSRDYVLYLNAITYVFPKAHAVEYGIIDHKLAYYRLHYPEHYEAALAQNKEKETA